MTKRARADMWQMQTAEPLCNLSYQWPHSPQLCKLQHLNHSPSSTIWTNCEDRIIDDDGVGLCVNVIRNETADSKRHSSSTSDKKWLSVMMTIAHTGVGRSHLQNVDPFTQSTIPLTKPLTLSSHEVFAAFRGKSSVMSTMTTGKFRKFSVRKTTLKFAPLKKLRDGEK